MLGKKIINTGSVACTTDTTQILDGGTTQSTALYRFEDNANDTSDSTGKFGKGAVFNGSNSYIDTGLNQNVGNNFTWSLWFNSDISDSNYRLLIDKTNSSSPYPGAGIALQGGNVYGMINGTGTNLTYTGNSYSINQWYHVALTSNGSTVKLYLNSVEVGTGSVSTTNTSQNILIGDSITWTTNYDGLIDQVRIFNKEASPSEITTLYNETTTTANTLQVLGDTSCLAAYTFEGNANDLSTNYNGTASNVIYDYNGTASNVTYATGKFDKAAVFNGTNSVIQLGTNVFKYTDVTISAFINPNLSDTNVKTIFANTSYISGQAFHGIIISVRNNGGSDKILVQHYPSSTATYSTGSISLNTFTHIAVSLTGSQTKIYINGSLDSTHSATFSYSASQTATASIGAYLLHDYTGSTTYDEFSGKIDQVRIFESVLSPGEINSLYNETTTTAALGTISDPSTVAYYKMQDATDETGSYNGTATNVDFNVQGKYGFAGKFNGSSSKIEVSNQVIPNGATSISFWYNPQGSTGTEYILGQGVATASKGPTVYWHSQSFGALVAKGTSSLAGSATGSTTYSTTAFHHVVFTWDGTSNSNAFKVYVNGSLLVQGTSDTSSSSIGSYTNFAIGGLNGSTFAEGRIDQVRIFNKVISADEVTKLYNEIQCADTITTPESYFDTALYVGNNTNRNITGIGFKPDFVWIKNRDSNSIHALYDSVRGPGTSSASNQLSSDTSNNTAWHSPNYGYLSAFLNNGFSLTNGSINGAAVNSNTHKTVAWAWKSGGILNQSASFNGSSSRITLPKLSTITADVTVSGWLNLGNTTTSNRIRFLEINTDANGYAGTLSVLYKPSNGQWVARAGNGTSSNSDVLTHTYTLTQSTWYHVCFTRNDSTNETKFYINGSLQDTETVSVSSSYPSNATGVIGDLNYSAGSNYNWLGTIDQVRIFNKSLSSSEVTQLYNETASTINTLQVLGDTSCMATYPLGTNANDLSTNYNGTASNITFNQPGHLNRNTNGTIESTVSASPESGFSIVKFDGYQSSGTTVGHGLNSTPELIIAKNLDQTTSWPVWFDDAITMTSTTFTLENSTKYLALNSTTGYISFTLDRQFGGTLNGGSGDEMIAYCFHSVSGYSKIGSYVGNGSTNGPSVYTGFEPAWIMIKRTDAAGAWNIFDNKRNSTNPRNSILQADKSDQEYTNTNYNINFYANGFQFLNSTADWNASNGKYIFMAIAANPDTTAPTEANSFKTKIFSANNSSQSITGLGFKPDFVWTKSRTNAYNHSIYDSIRGVNKLIQANTTNVQSSLSNAFNSFDSDGFTLGSGDNSNSGSGNSVAWAWKGLDHDRNLSSINTDGSIPSIVSANPAAGFSIVSLDKPNTNTDTYGHGLSSVPEMIILKRTASSDDWHVYHKDLGNTVRISLNSNAAKVTGTGVWASTTPTASLFTLQNQTGGAHIAYCFHSVAGYSKVAYYTGTGSAFNVTLGFTPGWVLIKRADGVGSWTIFDNQRSNGFGLSPDDNYGSASGGYNYSSIIQLSGTGAAGKIEHLGASAALNTAGNKYIYLAFSA